MTIEGKPVWITFKKAISEDKEDRPKCQLSKRNKWAARKEGQPIEGPACEAECRGNITLTCQSLKDGRPTMADRGIVWRKITRKAGTMDGDGSQDNGIWDI